MVIDARIIEMYLQGESEANLKAHWIFSNISEGATLFEMPSEENRDTVNVVYKQVTDSLKYFEPRNKQLFEAIFSNKYITKEEEIYVYLIVGLPNPYDAICRTNDSGKPCVIFDLIRIASYCDNDEKIQGLLKNLITHELTHVYLRFDYPSSNYSNGFVNRLKYIVFNEGFAHYLSLSDNILDYDFIKHRDKWESAGTKLKESLESNIMNAEKVLIEANTGSFWDKFGAISGMFGIFKYVNGSTNPHDKFIELYTKGPYFLTDYIIDCMK